LCDYGLQSAETSPAILKLVLESGDPCGVINALQSTNAVMLSGHLHATRYGGIFGSLNTVTFVRNPLDRVVSHYRHAVRDQGFKGPLMDFAREDTYINVQSRILAGLDPALVGVIGLTEQYRDSIDIINEKWGWKLEYRQENVSDQMSSLRVEPSSKEKREIEKLNERDFELYERASHLFANGVECLTRGIRHEPRGAISSATVAKGLNGWAFCVDSEEMAQIDVVINGSQIASLSCAGFRPGVAGWRAPRSGYVGFAMREVQLVEGDRVEIRDSKSQLLLDSTLVS